jgi:hypothetical protein
MAELAVALSMCGPHRATGADYAQEVLADRPVGYWRMDEGAPGPAADASGHERHGVYASLANPAMPPDLGQPAATEALGSSVDVATGAMGCMDAPGDGWSGGEFTVEVWLKPTRSGYEVGAGTYLQTVASTVAHGGQTGWDLALRGDPERGWAVKLAAAGRGEVGSDAPIVPHGVWSHLAASVDRERTVTLYVNGVVSHQGGLLPDIAPSSAPLRIGAPAAPQWSGNFAFFGGVDEVAFYDHALPAERIAAHFAAAGYAPPTRARTALRAVAGREPYTTETTGHVLLGVDGRREGPLTAEVRLGERVLAAGAEVGGGRVTAVPFEVDELPMGESRLSCRVTDDEAEVGAVDLPVLRLPPKGYEVKLDRMTGGLIVDRLPCVPFGLYCDADPGALAEEEVANGFNTLAPYWGVSARRDAADLARVRSAMDRCAAVGMRVHFHLNNLGVQPPSEAKWEALRAEVEAFRDHPALLAWYLADEPDSGVPYAWLEKARRFVRELDPYHPVTLVLMGADRVVDYGGGADVLMGDPYPIPHGTVDEAGRWFRRARELTGGLTPLWAVPQAFGGGEGTPREPTAGEIRVLTYLPLLEGARGVQYFVRRPPLGNPKSPITWSECRTLAMEIAELTPALLSAEEAPAVVLEPQTVQGRAFLDRGLLTLVAVNTGSAPTMFSAQIEGLDYTGPARLPFENREVAARAGSLSEPIDAFGTRVYQLPIGPLPTETVEVAVGNLILNPSWEESPSPGTPEGCYLAVGRDRGSTAAVDSRLARHGRHSLRLTTAKEGQGMTLSAFPMRVEPGRTYAMSVWAKGRTPGLRFRMELSGVAAEDFELTEEWRLYRFTTTVDGEPRRVNGVLSLTSAGVAWFDVLEVAPG